jgi:selenide,water dikinase
MPAMKIPLTETVKRGGCASKLPAGQLRHLLTSLSFRKPAQLLVGADTMDDACLWDLGTGQQLVQTLDFFTPLVDDALDFGAIAAANAMSDVYAMGGEPRIALSILAFPPAQLPLEMVEELLRGAMDKIHEAGACLAGGHTIEDDSLKFGLSVTGFVPAGRAWKNSGARPGDSLILTKPLGTGVITGALKQRKHRADDLVSAISSMKQLNRSADLLEGEEVHAAPDITGYGLAGHLLQMARASNAGLRIFSSSVPSLPGALSYLEEGLVSCAHRSNEIYVKESAQFSEISRALRWLLLDPQTSGGLLLSVPGHRASAIAEKLRQRFPHASIVGEVFSCGEGGLEFV